jgi:putative DNA primase/helicase
MSTVNFDNVPVELQQIPQWIVWLGDKVPYNARTGKQTGITWPDAGSDYSVARAAYESGGYSGIGFILGNGIVGIDLDHCITDGKLDKNSDAYKITRKLYSYTEISPSGTGLHISMLADIPGNIKTKDVEIYSHDRYFTVTGNAVMGWASGIDHATYRALTSTKPGYHISMHQDYDGELAKLYQKYHKPAMIFTSPTTTLPQGNGNGYPRRTDEQVIDAIKTRGNAECKALWYGAWADLYDSQSEADIALVRYIWYWSNQWEPAQIDRVFRQSGLYTKRAGRDYYKWDSLIAGTDVTYGWQTIGRVVAT